MSKKTGSKKAADKAKQEAQSLDTAINAMAEFKKLKQREKDIKTQLAMKKGVIINYMEENEIDTVLGEGDVVLATYKESTSVRFDAKAFKEAKPRMHAKFMTESTSSTLLVK